MNNYYMKLEWEEKTPLRDKVKALYNVLDFLSREMSIGRVPNNKEELENNIETTKQQLTTPLSIAFVRMVEKGEIDEVTASENAEMFLEWHEKVNYNVGEFRTYSIESEIDIGGGELVKQPIIKLYKCLQSHTSQADWAPDKSPALWKLIGIDENGIPEWSQPISSADAYMKGDECMYKGVHKRSKIDNNVWSPEEYPEGWEDVIEESESSSGDEVIE